MKDKIPKNDLSPEMLKEYKQMGWISTIAGVLCLIWTIAAFISNSSDNLMVLGIIGILSCIFLLAGIYILKFCFASKKKEAPAEPQKPAQNQPDFVVHHSENYIEISWYNNLIHLVCSLSHADGVFTLSKGGDYGPNDRAGFGDEPIQLTDEQIRSKEKFSTAAKGCPPYVVDQLWHFIQSYPKLPRCIYFAHGDFAYTLEKNGGGFHLFHRPTDRYDWSPIIDEDLPADYFQKHTVNQFCSYVETLIPNSAKLHRGLMENRLVWAGFIEKAPAEPKKPAAVSPHQHDLRYLADQAFQRGGLSREQAYGAYGLDVNGNPLPKGSDLLKGADALTTVDPHGNKVLTDRACVLFRFAPNGPGYQMVVVDRETGVVYLGYDNEETKTVSIVQLLGYADMRYLTKELPTLEQAILAQMTEQNYLEVIEELETFRKTNCIIQKGTNRITIDQYLPKVNLQFELKVKDGIFTLFQGGDHGGGDRTGFGDTTTLTPEQIATKQAFKNTLRLGDQYVADRLWAFIQSKKR